MTTKYVFKQVHTYYYSYTLAAIALPNLEHAATQNCFCFNLCTK